MHLFLIYIFDINVIFVLQLKRILVKMQSIAHSKGN